MQPFSYDIDRQIRLLFLGSALAAAANLAVIWALALPYLPVYYPAAAAAYLAMARTVRIRRFVPAYCAAFLLAAGQSFVSVYVLGDDCGIQLYLLALIIPCHYVRLTGCSQAFQRRFIIGACCACVVLYLISDELIDQVLTPLSRMDGQAEMFFTFLNVAGSLSLLVFVSSIFASGYQKELNRLRADNTLLSAAAAYDALTGLKNRRGMEPALQSAYGEWLQNGSPLSIAIGDVDHFKQLNDAYGHEAGDLVLKTLGELFSRWSDGPAVSVCRWGGEEFLFLLAVPEEAAACMLEGLRAQLAAQPFSCGGAALRVSMTFGVAGIRSGQTLLDLFRQADRGLYAGKENGRDQVVRAQPA